MSSQAVGTFTYWKLTNQEILQGSVLNFSQKQLLQNDLAQVADQILALDFNPQNPTKFAQDDAHLKGQMAAIRYMLIRSDESENALNAATG